MGDMNKKLFGTKVYPDQILRGAGQANARTGGIFKNPLGKMSPEELKDFQSVLREMQIDTNPDFVGGGNYGRTEQYSFLPFDQTPELKKKRQEKQSIFSFIS